jgi:predicted unusual protein kinase regulating ubiquinone biosynthesis (AarF/ABC1/UbiB family)
MEQLVPPVRSLICEKPVEAASIGQAHRATLTTGEQVIIKVQYLDVAEQFNTDFNNIMLVTRILNPERLVGMRAIRKRHEDELDFRLEAANLDEITRNIQAHGV